MTYLGLHRSDVVRELARCERLRLPLAAAYWRGLLADVFKSNEGNTR